MRWTAVCLGMLLLFGLTVGCKQQCFLAEEEFNRAHGLPPHLEQDPRAAIEPLVPAVATPATVDFPERRPHYLSLQEALAIALENGSTGSAAAGQGLLTDQLASFQGGQGALAGLVGQTDRMRVLAMNPAIAQANIEASLARFDAHWITAMNWSNTDHLEQGLTSFNNGQQAEFSSTILKGLPSGGVVSASFINDYQNLRMPPAGAFGVINPLYTSKLQLGFEQPLWRDFGIEINQLLNQLPSIGGATVPPAAAAAFGNKDAALRQTPSFGGVTTEGILLARLRFDASRAEFERQVQALLINVEVAYWRLYQSYGQLYANEEVMRLAHRAWMIAKAGLEAGRMAPADYSPIRAQYEEFRGERIKSLGLVLEAERNLRGLLGLLVEDGTRLVPITPPTLAPYSPDWSAALNDCMSHRPELILARDNLRASQFNLIAQQNFLKPDLRFFATYSPTGFGTRLDGNGTFIDATGTERTSNAFRSLAGDHFNDWNMGVVLNVPLGWRLEQAAVRSARLGLAQSYYFLKDQEQRAQQILDREFKKVSEWYRRIETSTAERRAYAEAVDARFKIFQAGSSRGEKAGGATYIDPLLESQRRLALAQAKEYEAIAEYNNSLARFEWAKGTMLEHDNINIAEGDLPVCAQVRAVENERQRSLALELAVRPNPDALRQPGMLAGHDPDTQPLPGDIGPMPRPLDAPALNQPKEDAAAAPAPGTNITPAATPPTMPTTMPALAPALAPPPAMPAPIAPATDSSADAPPWHSGQAAPPPQTTPPPVTSSPAPMPPMPPMPVNPFQPTDAAVPLETPPTVPPVDLERMGASPPLPSAPPMLPQTAPPGAR